MAVVMVAKLVIPSSRLEGRGKRDYDQDCDEDGTSTANRSKRLARL